MNGFRSPDEPILRLIVRGRLTQNPGEELTYQHAA